MSRMSASAASRDGAKKPLKSPLSATETISTAQDEAGSLAALVPRYLHAAHQHAEGRYREAAARVFGESGREDLVADPAWGAVVRRLYDAEAGGWDPARLLTIAKDTRELVTADSVAEVMSWRIDAIISARSPAEEKVDAGQERRSVRDNPVLPWLAGAPDAPSGATGLPWYLADGQDAIGARVAELADRAVREHPAWLSMLGPVPPDTAARDEWLRHIAVVAAYRDQHQVTADDPRQVLGPYVQPGHAGHRAYWHAASSVLAARRIAGLDAAVPGQRPPDSVTAQVAVDVYRSLPESERAEIAAEIAAKAGVLWLGDRTEPDEDAAAQTAYASYLAAELTARKHLRPARASQRPRAGEPVEAAFARRGRPRSEAPSARARDGAPVTAPRQQPRLVPRQETWQQHTGPVPGR